MTELSALWLPILLGAVFCFIASSIIHMAPLWHKNEYPQLPDEEKARAAIGALNVPPGDYMLPRCKSMKEMGSEEFKEKLRQGPKWIITVMPPGEGGMAASLVYWFLFQLLVLRIRGVCVEPRAGARRALSRSVPLHRRHGVHGLRARADAAVHLVSARVGHHAQAHVRRADLRLHCRRHVRVAVAESHRDVKWGPGPVSLGNGA